MTTVVSAIALLFSAYSLWETSLKQADLSVYVTGVVTYERDGSAAEYIKPVGGFEVFAVPITIANSGAREAPVLGLQLDGRNPRTDLAARFEATYIADGAYFATSGGRPKTPFSALVVAGRSTWTGTVLFYPVRYSNGKSLTPSIKISAGYAALRKKYGPEMDKLDSSSFKVLREKRPDLAPKLDEELAELGAADARLLSERDEGDNVELTLQLVSPAPRGWLDRALGTPLQPIALTLSMPDIPELQLSRGERVRLRTADTGS